MDTFKMTPTGSGPPNKLFEQLDALITKLHEVVDQLQPLQTEPNGGSQSSRTEFSDTVQSVAALRSAIYLSWNQELETRKKLRHTIWAVAVLTVLACVAIFAFGIKRSGDANFRINETIRQFQLLSSTDPVIFTPSGEGKINQPEIQKKLQQLKPYADTVEEIARQIPPLGPANAWKNQIWLVEWVRAANTQFLWALSHDQLDVAATWRREGLKRIEGIENGHLVNPSSNHMIRILNLKAQLLLPIDRSEWKELTPETRNEWVTVLEQARNLSSKQNQVFEVIARNNLAMALLLRYQGELGPTGKGDFGDLDKSAKEAKTALTLANSVKAGNPDFPVKEVVDTLDKVIDAMKLARPENAATYEKLREPFILQPRE